MPSENKYCIDASALIDLGTRYYPKDIFPTLWEKIEACIHNEEILFAPRQVLVELERKDDDIYKWAKKNKEMFLDLNLQEQEIAKDILTKFPKLVDTSAEKEDADPFLIALAKVKRWTVISSEVTGGKKKIPIPDVCYALKVKHISVLEYFREQKWSI